MFQARFGSNTAEWSFQCSTGIWCSGECYCWYLPDSGYHAASQPDVLLINSENYYFEKKKKKRFELYNTIENVNSNVRRLGSRWSAGIVAYFKGREKKFLRSCCITNGTVYDKLCKFSHLHPVGWLAWAAIWTTSRWLSFPFPKRYHRVENPVRLRVYNRKGYI